MGHPRGLREEESTLTPGEKSAEGLGGGVTQTPGEVRLAELGTRPADRQSRGRTLAA